jgi:hypothetical protein
MSEWYLTLTAISLPLSSLWAAATSDATVTRPSASSGAGFLRPSFGNGGTTFAASSGTRSFGSGSGAKLLDAGGLGKGRNESLAPVSPLSAEKGWKENV